MLRFIMKLFKRTTKSTKTQETTPAPAPKESRLLYDAPKPDQASMVAYYGEPGDESKLTTFDPPYPMFLAWDTDTPVTKIRCHAKIATPLELSLTEIRDVLGLEYIDAHDLDLYGGCYNYRNSRNSTNLSTHAYGAAIDLNPDDNANRTPWHKDKIDHEGYASMPLEVIEIFEKYGFKSGARAWGRDAMHFQFTQ